MDKLKQDLIEYFKKTYPNNSYDEIEDFVDDYVNVNVEKEYTDHSLIVTITPVWKSQDELLHLRR